MRALIVSLAMLMAACAHSVNPSRQPSASVAGGSAGCSVLGRVPRVSKLQFERSRAVYRMFDPATRGRFFTVDGAGCGAQGYDVEAIEGFVPVADVHRECQALPPDRPLKPTALDDTPTAYLMIAPDERFRFVTADPAACESLGLKRERPAGGL